MSDTDSTKRTLRHGLTQLWPSEIAEQSYCEYKVHLKRLHPEVRFELPVLERGETNHAILTSQVAPVTKVEIEQAIQDGKKLAVCERELEGEFNGVQIRGRTDFFAFEGQKALLLLDFKFTNAKQPYPDQIAQAEIYALLVEHMLFSTAEFCFGIVLVPSPSSRGYLQDGAQTKVERLQWLGEEGVLQAIHEQCETGRRALIAGKTMKKTISSANWAAFLFRYNALKAERNLKWALEYWLSMREPIPVKRVPRKCFACPLNAASFCEHALMAPDPTFQIQEHSNGQIFIYR